MGQYLLGVDNGSTVSKAVLFDLHGKEIAVARAKGWGNGSGDGWFIGPGNPRVILHGGQVRGGRTAIHRYLDDKTSIILLTNQEIGILDTIAEAIGKKLLESEYGLNG